MSWLKRALWAGIHQCSRPGLDRIVGRQLKGFRELAGASREDVAALLFIPERDIAKFETGRKRISAAKLYVLARHFDVPVAVFFGDKREVG